jgi:DNA-binding PadR family transcriptional regulator
MSPVFRHGRLRLYLLKLLDESPRHGYEVIRLLQDRFMGVYAPSPGTIYPRLARLEEEGLVTHDEADGRKVYRITDKGRAELHARHGDLTELEEEITASVRDIAREVTEDVRETVRTLREELTWAAREFHTRARQQASDAAQSAAEGTQQAHEEAQGERDKARDEAHHERDKARDEAHHERDRAQDEARRRRDEAYRERDRARDEARRERDRARNEARGEWDAATRDSDNGSTWPRRPPRLSRFRAAGQAVQSRATVSGLACPGNQRGRGTRPARNPGRDDRPDQGRGVPGRRHPAPAHRPGRRPRGRLPGRITQNPASCPATPASCVPNADSGGRADAVRTMINVNLLFKEQQQAHIHAARGLGGARAGRRERLGGARG